MMSEMGRFNDELFKADVMLSGYGLHPSSKGVRVRFLEGANSATKGSFGEPNQFLADFWICR